MASTPETDLHWSRALSVDDGFLWSLIDAVPDGMVITDADGRIVLVNRQLEHMFGYERDELFDEPVDVLVPLRFRAAHIRLREHYVAQPHVRSMESQRDLWGRRKDGSDFPIEISLSPLRANGRLLVIATVRDVTGRRAAEAELQGAHERALLAEDHERIARDLHDTVIQRLFASGLTLQAVAPRVDEPERDKLLAILDEHDRIIREIRTAIFGLTTSKAHEGELRASVLGVVDEAARALGFRPGVRFHGVLDSATDAHVTGHLVAVLREALANAARHAAASRVDVEIGQDGEVLTLEVSDNGLGIGEHVRGGLGLQNMAERASSLGGTCTVTPGTVGGTVVRWQVPAREVPHPPR